ncbi:MAG TPA: hypothetical protein VMW41_01560 [Candidatus Bathyarchaeia archaeon]|nr:hypothetical protein [Candidatus Bathyarchaeia archaeon]
MLIKTIFAETVVFIISSRLIFSLLRDFKVSRKKAVYFLLPLLVYSAGFSLRLTGDKSLIDLGFFFTDFSTIFVTVLFSLCLYLGQLKYWKIK